MQQHVKITTGAFPSQDVVEAPANSIETALEKLPGIIEENLKRTKIPGMAVAVVHAGKTVFAQGYGVKKLGGTAAIDAQTVFQIASLSKPVGATVVASQVSNGALSWETPISALLPGFALNDPYISGTLTVGDLYSHRSGLPKAAGDSLEDIGHDRSTVLRRLALVPLQPFRSSYNYSNFGLTAAAEAVAQQAGLPWEELSQRELYTPLGMDSTSSTHAGFLARANRAALHAKTATGFAALFERNADAQSPAGGVSSNVEDLAKWMALILGQGTVQGQDFIKPEALLPAVTAHMIAAHSSSADDRASHYGYGFGVGTQPGGRVSLSHSGAFLLGAGTCTSLIPSLDVGIVVLTNAGPIGAAEAVGAEFLDCAQFGAVRRDWVADYGMAMAGYFAPEGDLAGAAAPSRPAPSDSLEGLAGTYANAYHGPASVQLDAGKLTVSLGPEGNYALPLRHWDANVFSFVPTGENAPEGSLSSAAFGVGAGGSTTLRLEFFDSLGLGTWVRS